MTELNILSVNTQGLGGIAKRLDVFQYLKEKKADIYCLQDTHITKSQEIFIRNQWGDSCMFSPAAQSNARGVAILFGKRLEYTIHNYKADGNGNFLMIDMTAYNNRFTLVNLYGPNNDDPSFFKTIFDSINELGNTSYIICGDFNLVQNPSMDYYNYKHVNNPKAREYVLKMINENNLTDPFRENNPLSRRYTWRRKNPIKQARLDFFLLAEEISSTHNVSKIEPGYKTDHSIIRLSLTLDDFEHGKGLWKHNNSHLSNPEYLKIINEKILEVKTRYSLPVYNKENIDNIPDDEIEFIIDDNLFLETLLMEIRGSAISFASFRKKKNSEREVFLNSEIEKLENDLTEDSFPLLEAYKNELQKLREIKMQGHLIRSRANLMENSEKPSKFFCSLESHNYSSKIIHKLENEHGELINDQNQILLEVRNYYSALYMSQKEGLDNTDLNSYVNSIPKLSEQESTKLEGLINLSEASETLYKMANNKSPGSSGFNAEFFKVFWRQIGCFVVRSINYSYQKGELSITQKQGLITCIPKENKPKQFLKNWRPITLLNTVYKIASGSIAGRIKTVINKLIHKDQTGFIEGRFIGENTRLIYDLMQYTEENNIPGLLLLIDFEKAFDSLSWAFIDKVLKLYNFGNSIRRWIKVFSKNANSSVMQCGFLSSFFNIGRGCRQGDPISPYLFILCAEVLAARIRNNENISGIKVENKEIKISQFADDTSLMLDGSSLSFTETMKELTQFANLSGLKINYDKTQVVWIGAKKYSSDSIKTRWKLKWGITSFKILGITYDVDLDKMGKLNFLPKIEQIEKILKQWQKRYLTPFGKITVIKSLLLPKLTHLFLSLPNPDDHIIRIINNLFYDFLWQGRTKIKQQVVVKSYIEGGLKMINLQAFISAMKTTWIRRSLKEQSNWQLLLKQNLCINKICSCGSEYFKEVGYKMKNHFWKDVLKAVSTLFALVENVNTDNNIQTSPIFLNHLFCIDGKSFFYKSWFEKGIKFVNDILNDDGSFINLQTLTQDFGVKSNFIQYHGVIQCIKAVLKNKGIRLKNKLNVLFIPSGIEVILKQNKGAQNIYNVFNTNSVKATGITKWNSIYDFQETTWENIFKAPYTITNCTKLRWFQLQINHHVLTTNKFLHQIQIKESPLCTFCNNATETIQHLLWTCPKTQLFIKDLLDMLNELQVQVNITETEFIFNNFHTRVPVVLQFLLLLAKYFIYVSRCSNKPLLMPLYKLNVQSYYKSLMDTAVRTNTLDTFIQDWIPFQNLFQ